MRTLTGKQARALVTLAQDPKRLEAAVVTWSDTRVRAFAQFMLAFEQAALEARSTASPDLVRRYEQVLDATYAINLALYVGGRKPLVGAAR